MHSELATEWCPEAIADIPEPQEILLPEDGRPRVRLPGDNHLLSDTAEEVGHAVGTQDLFRRGDLVFTLQPDGQGLQLMDGRQFRTWCEQFIVCYKLRSDNTGGLIKPMRTMSKADADGILSSPQFLRELRTVEKFNPVRMPVIRRNGALELLSEGYDEESLTYTASNGVEIETIPSSTAQAFLRELLSEFVFTDNGRSAAVAVAGMLSVFGRGLLPPAALPPAFVFLANREGAGKTLLMKICTVPVLGHAPAGAWASKEEEMDKRLLTAVMSGLPVLVFDNVRNRIASASLEAFLTNPHYKGRVLGESREFTGQKSTVVFITANGATVSPDMRRRSLFAELFLEAERAEDRVFKKRLEVPPLLAMRGQILSALWSVITDWDEAGRPKPSKGNSGFNDWSDIIGGIVEHAGFSCPLETAEIEGAGDTQLADMRTLADAMGAKPSPKDMTPSEVLTVVKQLGLFSDVVQDEPGQERGAKAKLASILMQYSGGMIGNWRFIATGQGRSRRYRVAPLQSAK